MMKRLGKFGRSLSALLVSALLIVAFAACVDADDFPVRNFTVEGADEYYIDNGFFYNDFTLRVVRENGKEFTVPLDSSMISAEDRELLQTTGTHNVAVTYEGVTVIHTFRLLKTTSEYYTITFNPNEGEPIPKKQYSVGSRFDSFNDVPVTVRRGYTLAGWRVNDAEGVLLSPTSGFDTPFLINTDFTFIAEWVRNTATVSFDIALYPGEIDPPANPDPQIVDTNIGKVSEPKRAAESRPGFRLNGWYTSRKEISSNEYEYDEYYNFNKPIGDAGFTLYAKWSIAEYPVTFHLNGGTMSYNPDDYKSITYNTDLSALRPDDPDKDNYTFIDWYESKDFSGEPFVFGNMPGREVSLYARWEPNLSYIFEYELLLNKTLRITGTKNKDKDFSHITIPASAEFGGKTYPISEIGDQAFYQCFNLVEITFAAGEGGIKRIGERAFMHANSLRSLVFDGASVVEYVGRDAFSGTRWLSAAKSNADQAVYVTLGKVLVAYVGAAQSLDMTTDDINTTADEKLPEYVAYIATGAFSSLTYLTDVTVADSIEVIETGAFADCSALNVITFTESSRLAAMSPGSLSSTPWYDGNFSSSEYMVICGGVLYAYKGNADTASVTIPATVTRIESNALYAFGKLNTVTFMNERGITSVGENAFNRSAPFVKDAGQFAAINGILIQANSASSVIRVPANIKSVAAGAFRAARTTLKHVVFEGNVKIFAGAFSGINGALTVSFINDGALDLFDPEESAIEEGAFAASSSSASVTVYIPAHKFGVFAAAPVWNFYDGIIRSLEVVSVSVVPGTLRNNFPNDENLSLKEQIAGATLRLTRNDEVTYDIPLTIDNFYDYGKGEPTKIAFGVPGPGKAVISYKDSTRGTADDAPYVFTVFEYTIDAKLISARVGVTTDGNTLKTAAYVEINGEYRAYDKDNSDHQNLTRYYTTLRDKYFESTAIDLTGLTINLLYNDGTDVTAYLTRFTAASGDATFEARSGGTVTGTFNVRLTVSDNKLGGSPVNDGRFSTQFIGSYEYKLTVVMSNGDTAAVLAPDGLETFAYVVKKPEAYSIRVDNVKTEYYAGEAITLTPTGVQISIVRENGGSSGVAVNSPYLKIPAGDTSYPLLNDGRFDYSSLDDILGEKEFVDENGVLHRRALLSYDDEVSGRIYSVFEYTVKFFTHPELFKVRLISDGGAAIDGVNASVAVGGSNVYLPNVLVIPETVTVNGATHTVREIAASAFKGNSGIQYVYVPAGVGTIGSEAFANTASLKRVLFSSALLTGEGNVRLNLTSSELSAIPAKAFFNASALDAVTLPAAVVSIGESAFEQTAKLQSFSVPAGGALTEFGAAAFKNSGLPELNLSGVTINSVGASMFSYAKIKIVKFGTATFTRIPNDMFRGASLFKGFSAENGLPSSVVAIGEYAFANSGGSSGGQSFDLTSIKTVGAHAFDNSEALRTLTLGSALKSIGDYAFYQSGSADMEAVTVPSSVGTLGAYAFAGSRLSTLTIGGGEIPLTIGDYAFSGSLLTTITLPARVKTLGKGAFKDCASLTSATFADEYEVSDFGITATGVEASFKKSSSTLSVIPAYTFDGCSILTEFKYTASEATAAAVGDYAFNNAVKFNAAAQSALKGVRYIGARAFANTALTVNDAQTDAVAFIGADAVFGDHAFADNKGIKRMTVSGGVKTALFGTAPFSGCTEIKELYTDGKLAGNAHIYKLFASAPEGVTANLKNVFIEKAGNEDEITVQAGLLRGMIYVSKLILTTTAHIRIESGAFNGMKSLLELTIPEDAEFVNGVDENKSAVLGSANGILTGADNLKTLYLPAQLRFIDLFITGLDISKLNASETYRQDYQRLLSAVLPGNLISVTVTAGVADETTTLADNGFRGAKTLQSVKLPDGLTVVGVDSFTDCSGLKSIVIPDTVTEFNPAFGGCTSLKTMTFKSTEKLKFTDLFPSVEATSDNALKGLYHVYAPESLTEVILSGRSTAVVEHSLAFAFDLKVQIYIPSSVANGADRIADAAFIGTPVTAFKIYEVNADGAPVVTGAGVWNFVAGTAYSVSANSLYQINKSDGTSTNILKAYATALSNNGFNLAASVKEIADGAFAYAQNLNRFSVEAREDGLFGIDSQSDSIGGRSLYYYPNPKAATDYEKNKFEIVVYAAASGGGSYNVTKSCLKVRDYAFAGASHLKSLVFSNEIETEIGKFAFADTGVTGGLAPNAEVWKIGDYAFLNMRGLSSAEIKSTMVKEKPFTIGKGAFQGTRLTNLSLPFLGVREEDEESAFVGYSFGAPIYTDNAKYVPSTLKTVTVYAGVINTNAGNGLNIELVFTTKTDENGVTYSQDGTILMKFPKDTTGTFIIPEGVVSIYKDAFNGAAIEGIDFSNVTGTLTTIGEGAFRDCVNLTQLDIPAGVTSIGSYAFYGLTGLTSLTIPDGVVDIGNYAFFGLTKLTSLTVPKGVKSVGNYAFADLTNLTSINFNAERAYDLFANNNVFANAGKEGGGITLTIGAGVSALPSWMFNPSANDPSAAPKITAITVNATELKTVGTGMFGESVKGLVELNFNGDIPDLTRNNGLFDKAGQGGDGIKVTFGAGATKIANYLFNPYSDKERSPKIKEINFLVTGLTAIGGYAFAYYNGALKTLALPESVASIGAYAFAYGAFTEVTFGNNSVLTELGDHAFRESGLTAISLPAGVKAVGEYAFYGCGSLQTASFTNVISIGGHAFDKSGLTALPLNSAATVGFETIGEYAFAGSKIENLIIYAPAPYTDADDEQKVKTVVVKDRAFSNISTLTSLTIEADVSLGNYAFESARNLTSITVNAPQITSLTARNFVFINAGHDGNGITVTFGEEVVIIPAYLFASTETEIEGVLNPKVASVVINGMGTHIGPYAFSGCGYLMDVTFVEGWSAGIGVYAFSGCKSLTIELPEGTLIVAEFAFEGVIKVICPYTQN
ncbi:MAG: leucine-rich repeat protein, partial [Clostridiales bacterium]|nr:leucine-rich repeat protein [Clostridiales bacterium]